MPKLSLVDQWAYLPDSGVWLTPRRLHHQNIPTPTWMVTSPYLPKWSSILEQDYTPPLGRKGRKGLAGISGEGPATTLSYEGTWTDNHLFIRFIVWEYHSYMQWVLIKSTLFPPTQFFPYQPTFVSQLYVHLQKKKHRCPLLMSICMFV